MVGWFLLSHRPSKVIVAAPTSRQVKQIVFREVATMYKSVYPLLSKYGIKSKLNQAELELDDDWFAVGLSTDDPDKFQGFHSKHILVLVDEAAGIPPIIYDAIDGILSSGEMTKLVMFGNPTARTGRFYDAFNDPKAKSIQISAFDTPNFTDNLLRTPLDLKGKDFSKVKLTAPHLIKPSWVQDKIRRWGASSPVFQSRIMGKFPKADKNTLISLDLIEEAVRRHEKMRRRAPNPNYALDVARFGDDKSVVCKRFGNRIESFTDWQNEDTMATAAMIAKILKAERGDCCIDTIGVGGGVADRLREMGFSSVFDVNVAEPAGEDDVYANRRAELYMHLKKLFENGDIGIPDDDELIAQLSNLRYQFEDNPSSRNRRLQIEPKKEYKKRTGYSPDKADALMISYAEEVLGSPQIHVIEY